MDSPIVDFQLATRDPAGAQAFLEKVFGWKFREGAGRVVASIDTGHREIPANDIFPSGALLEVRPGQEPYTSIWVRVHDLDRSVAKASELGASIIVPRTRTAQRNDIAIIRTPQELVMGIVQL